MSIKQYPGGIITKNPTAPTTSSARGIWTVDQAADYIRQGIWPRIPGAPTIGTASISAGSTTASVTFTAPTDLGTGAITYTATSSPGGLTGTGASPISVAGLTVGTAYTFTVRGATPGGSGPSSAASNSITPTAVVGQTAYTNTGTYTFVVPTGVTSVSVVAVGAGSRGCMGGLPRGGGGGGALAYANNISVTPGESICIRVAAGNTTGGTGESSRFRRGCTNLVAAGSGVYGGGGGAGGTVITGTGFSGGNGGSGCTAGYGTGGGGGAGGYAGAGGAGAAFALGGNGVAGTGGAGGGGGSGGASGSGGCQAGGGGGGGIGLLGQGCSGAGGASIPGSTGGRAGAGGSGGFGGLSGQRACCTSRNSEGGIPGGGGGGGCVNTYTGGKGAVRIIYPGNTRSFPSTNTGNL